MKRQTEKQFQQIAEDAERAASKVECSIEEFYDGLDAIIEHLKERRAVGLEEIGRHAAVEAVVALALPADQSPYRPALAAMALRALREAVASGRLSAEQAGAAVGVRAELEHRALTRDGAEWEPLAPPLTVAAVGEHSFRAVLVSGSPQGHPGPCPDDCILDNHPCAPVKAFGETICRVHDADDPPPGPCRYQPERKPDGR